MNLTSRQKEVLNAITNLYVKKGRVPTYEEVRKHLGYRSVSSIQVHVNALKRKGYLSKEKGAGLKLQTYSIDVAKNVFSIPLVGQVACGNPQLADEDIIEYVTYRKKLNGNVKDYFFLRAIGDSMNLAGIDDKDLLLVKRQSSIPDNSDKAVVLIGSEATIKYLKRINGAYYLYPKSKSKKHKPIRLLNLEDVYFCGVVKDIIKK